MSGRSAAREWDGPRDGSDRRGPVERTLREPVPMPTITAPAPKVKPSKDAEAAMWAEEAGWLTSIPPAARGRPRRDPWPLLHPEPPPGRRRRRAVGRAGHGVEPGRPRRDAPPGSLDLLHLRRGDLWR